MKKIFLIGFLFILAFGNIKAQWVVVSDTSFNAEVEVFSDNENYLYAALPSKGLYRTSNYGASWTSSYVKINSRFANCLASKDSLVFVAHNLGLSKSTNYGSNWDSNGISSVSIIFSSNYLLLGNDDGVYRSSNFGVNWILVNNNLPWSSGLIRHFAFSNNNLFLAMDSNGIGGNLRIYKSTNNGDNWVLISQNIPSNYTPYSLYACENLVLCGTASGVYKSTNYGTNWALIPGIPGNIGLFGFASSGTKNIFISAWDYGVYVSNDYGESFNLKNEGLQSLRCTALYKFSNFLFLGTNPYTLPCKIYRRPISEAIGIEKISTEIPDDFKLYQNYPNPFNPTTNIKYSVKREMSNVKLIIYDLLGKEVATLVNENQSPGTYEVTFDARALSSGIYFYSLYSDGILIDCRKMVLMK